jgi:protein involved in plasmid replication-relaxation
MTQARPDTYAELRLAEGKLLGWDERKKTAACAVQPRDAEILTALARYRFLTTAQIAELWWNGCGMRAVRRRMTQLFGAGLVERFRPQTIRGAFQWTYCLTSDGFRAAQQSGELPAGLKFTPRRERLFDYRYVVHDLRVNEWAIRYRELAGDNLLDWAGPDESRIEPTKKQLPDGGWTPNDVWHIAYLNTKAVRPIQPDARVEVAHTTGDLMMYVEYDRTRRVDKNYDKFRRYETFICWWWEWTHLREWEQPVVVFICQDDDHRLRFLHTADAEFQVRHSRWIHREEEGNKYVEKYPARDRVLFALEEDIHNGSSGALRLPPWPPGHENREQPGEIRRAKLPGLHADD